ncbi:TOBE domain-containing protein [Sinorhizobium fredii]|uniref:TOBE domain-containing protein n=1 Tax=Rhizobium fredii TaxID=380 RepID=UPI001F33D52E|nr:TOBE domain-containing protein [Sinorhizobium fredii]
MKARITGESATRLSVETPRFGGVTVDKSLGYLARNGIATIGIRPERLRVLWDDAKAEFEIAGKVVDRHYFGEITHLVIDIPGLEQPLSVSETNNFGANEPDRR